MQPHGAGCETTRALRSPALRAQAAAWLMLAALVVPSAVPDERRSWQVTEADVRVVCPMTIGGSFEAKTRALSGTLTLTVPRPPAFAGALAVDLSTLDTGIGLRNQHLREKYLEVGRGEGFDKARLSDIRVGDIDPEIFEGRTTFTGSFLLHGVTKVVSGHTDVRHDGAKVRLEATFPVVIPDYGIEKPRYLGVGVKDQVRVHVSLVATPVPSAGGSQ